MQIRIKNCTQAKPSSVQDSPLVPLGLVTSLDPEPPDRKLINECKRGNVVDKFNKIVHAQLVSPRVNRAPGNAVVPGFVIFANSHHHQEKKYTFFEIYTFLQLLSQWIYHYLCYVTLIDFDGIWKLKILYYSILNIFLAFFMTHGFSVVNGERNVFRCWYIYMWMRWKSYFKIPVTTVWILHLNILQPNKILFTKRDLKIYIN